MPGQGVSRCLVWKSSPEVTWVLRLLEDLDSVAVTYFKKLTGTEEIWECRIEFGSNAYRLFCFFLDGCTVVLTHGLLRKHKKHQELKFIRRKCTVGIFYGGGNE
jgi:hypothetical protein